MSHVLRKRIDLRRASMPLRRSGCAVRLVVLSIPFLVDDNDAVSGLGCDVLETATDDVVDVSTRELVSGSSRCLLWALLGIELASQEDDIAGVVDREVYLLRVCPRLRKVGR